MSELASAEKLREFAETHLGVGTVVLGGWREALI